jgi:uncharacterized protein (TIGR02145 family)
MKTKALIPYLFATLFLLSNCKPDELIKVTKIQTGTVSAITSNSASVSATFIDLSGNIDEFGHCWATTSEPSPSDNKYIVNGTSKKGEFSSHLSDLHGGTNYYVRAFAKEGDKLVYGKVIDFTTLETKTIAITSPVKDVKWLQNSNETISWTDNISENVKIELYKGGGFVESIISSTASDGSHSWTIKQSYIPGTDYSIKITSIDDAGISAESEKFEIVEGPYIAITDPVSTSDWQKGSSHTIRWTDNIAENVKIELFKGGVKNSDISNSTLSDGSENWSVPNTLTADNDYRIKISSINIASLFDESDNFTVSKLLPTVVTQAANSISGTNATLNGTVNANGSSVNVSFEWGETTAYGNTVNTTPATINGNVVTSVSASISGLKTGTTYHFRLKAGNTYGDDMSFTTTTPAQPTVTTGLISEVKYTSASCGGEVTSGGTESVTERGICWSTNQNPTINDGKLPSGTGTGTFSCNLSGLNNNTTYYIRAYATNSVGTGYGEQKSFKTEAPPVVTTSSITPGYITASGGGTVTNVGSIGVSARGICWGISSNPTILDNTTIDGNGIGAFASSISGLELGATYYVKAYATNILGTVYGSQVSFVTLNTLTYNGLTYNLILVNGLVWMAENLRTSKDRDGNPIQQVGDNNTWMAMTTPAYCWYDNNYVSNNKYGALYNWYAVSAGNLCPTGWHVASTDDWNNLSAYLIANDYNYDGSTTGNKIAKAMAATTDWGSSTVTGAPGNTDYPGYRNKSGFTALPSGFRSSVDGLFWHQSFYGDWYSGTPYGSDMITFQIGNGSVGLNSFISYASSKSAGESIRCVKD